MKTGDPLSKAELVTGRYADPNCRVEPIDEEMRDWREPAEVGMKDRLACVEEVGEGGWVCVSSIDKDFVLGD